MNISTIQQMTEDLSMLTVELSTKLQHEEIELRKLGIGLPLGTVTKLHSVQTELGSLAERINEQITELNQLRTLATTTEWINSSLDLDDVLNKTMDQVLQLTGAERGYIVLQNPITSTLETQVARSMQTDDGDNVEEFIMSETIVQRVIKEGETVITTNAREDSRFMTQESIIGYALRSIICVPLTSRDRVIGAVYCDNRFKDGLFGVKEKRLVTGFANQAAIAIENAQLFEQLTAALDEITEIRVLLDNILASILSGVITTNADGFIVTANPAAASILGHVQDALIGQPIQEILGTALYEQIETAMHNAQEHEATTTVESDIDVDERGSVSLKINTSLLKDPTPQDDNDRAMYGYALVIDDMTELKNRDRTLAAVRRYLPPVMVDNIRSIEKLGLGGERHVITVLFAEVRPFDSFPKSLSPRELMELLNTYHTLGSEAVHNHAGMIDKYMGNEIMAIFNTQLNPSDTHALDAIQAAMRMAADFQAMRAFGRIAHMQSEQNYFRIGIHTGIATLGNVGSSDRREFSAIGDTVNLAKRLQENALPGQLIISQATYDACNSRLDEMDWLGIRQLAPMQVKGRSSVVNVYQLFDKDELA